MAVVSIVIPAHNCERYLAGTIRSLRRQTHPEIEVVVVDDGSTDGTGEIARSFGEPVRLLRQENAGPSVARNAGLAAARGEYVAFLDADDEFEPERVAVLVRALEGASARASFATTDAWLWDGSRRLCRYNPSDLGAGEVGMTRFLDDNRPYIGILARREVLIEAGGFRSDLWLNEDFHLWLRLLAGGRTYVHVPDPLYLYRVRYESLSRDRQAQLEVACRVYREVLTTVPLTLGQRRRVAYLLWRDRARLYAAESRRARVSGELNRRAAYLARGVAAQAARVLLRPHFSAWRLWLKRGGEYCVLCEIAPER